MNSFACFLGRPLLTFQWRKYGDHKGIQHFSVSVDYENHRATCSKMEIPSNIRLGDWAVSHSKWSVAADEQRNRSCLFCISSITAKINKTENIGPFLHLFYIQLSLKTTKWVIRWRFLANCFCFLPQSSWSIWFLIVFSSSPLVICICEFSYWIYITTSSEAHSPHLLSLFI